MKRISLCSVALLGSVWLLTGCSKEAAEKKRIETEVRIIQCEAGRWGGADDFLTRLFLDRAQGESAMRRRAAMAMGRIGQPAFIPSLRQTLNDADAGIAGDATLLAIGEILDAENTALYGTVPDPEVIDAIHRCLTDPAAIVRARAVEALGKTGRQEFARSRRSRRIRTSWKRKPGNSPGNGSKHRPGGTGGTAVPAMIRLLASPVGGTAARMLAPGPTPILTSSCRRNG